MEAIMNNQIDNESRKEQIRDFRFGVADRIRDRLKANKMKNDDLALATGLSINTINAITCGRQNVNPMDLSVIAEELGCSLDYLMTGKEQWMDISPDLVEVLRKLDYGDCRTAARLISALIER